MRESRFTEGQMVKILREADKVPMAEWSSPGLVDSFVTLPASRNVSARTRQDCCSRSPSGAEGVNKDETARSRIYC
jgi:hypothetical protein